MNKLIKFVDTIEDDAEEQYGVLMDDEYVLCLCCGGTFEKDEYIITDILEWREILVTTIKNKD